MKRIGERIVEKLIKEEGEVLSTAILNATIKEYIIERKEELVIDEDEDSDEYSFSSNSTDIFIETSSKVENIINQLTKVSDEEGDVVIATDTYSTEFIQDIVARLEGVVDDLEFLSEL